MWKFEFQLIDAVRGWSHSDSHIALRNSLLEKQCLFHSPLMPSIAYMCQPFSNSCIQLPFLFPAHVFEYIHVVGHAWVIACINIAIGYIHKTRLCKTYCNKVYQKELTEGDMWVWFMCPITSTAIQCLLHVLLQLVAQCTQWTCIHNELSGRWYVQVWVKCMTQ